MLVAVTALPFAALGAWRLLDGRFPLMPVLLTLQLVLLVNVASHLAQAYFVNGYVPGLATSVLLNLPFSLYLFHRAFWERWMPRALLGALVPVAIVVHGPMQVRHPPCCAFFRKRRMEFPHRTTARPDRIPCAPFESHPYPPQRTELTAMLQRAGARRRAGCHRDRDGGVWRSDG